MSRQEELEAAVQHFDSGRFVQTLAARIAVRSASANFSCALRAAV